MKFTRYIDTEYRLFWYKYRTRSKMKCKHFGASESLVTSYEPENISNCDGYHTSKTNHLTF